MLVATVNVNGIRAAAKKGMGEWIAKTNADILLLQEVRAPEGLVADIVGDAYTVIPLESILKGRAGVAVAVRDGLHISEIRRGLPAELSAGDAEPGVDTGRWLEIDVPDLDTTFVSAYLHSGVATDELKMAAKYSHLDRVTTRLDTLANQGERTLGNLLVAGDFNIVHSEKDIANWKPNHNKTAGVLDAEIAYLDRWFDGYGLVDVQRAIAGDGQGPYTWWSQRGKAFDNDTGWRIDYQMTNPQLAQKANDFRVDRAPSYDTRWSDHAPLVINYDIG